MQPGKADGPILVLGLEFLYSVPNEVGFGLRFCVKTLHLALAGLWTLLANREVAAHLWI